MELARRFDAAIAEFASVIEACSDAQWAAVCGDEGWTVGQTAQHVAGQFPLEMEFVTAAAEKRPLPDYTWDDVNAKNDDRALRNHAATKPDVLRELRAGAATTSAYLRSLGDEQLDATGTLGLAGGAAVTTEQVIEGGVLIAHVTGHLQSIRGARVQTASR